MVLFTAFPFIPIYCKFKLEIKNLQLSFFFLSVGIKMMVNKISDENYEFIRQPFCFDVGLHNHGLFSRTTLSTNKEDKTQH